MPVRKVLLSATFICLASASLGQDWGGVYVGVQTNSVETTTAYIAGGIAATAYSPGGGSMHGLFAGYLRQAGNFVVGGEIAYLSGEPTYDNFPTYYFTNMLDLKARAGYSFGRVLPYAVIGWSMTKLTVPETTPSDAGGLAYGLGVDIRVSDRVLLGLEYLNRDLATDAFIEAPNLHAEGDFSTFGVRVAYEF